MRTISQEGILKILKKDPKKQWTTKEIQEALGIGSSISKSILSLINQGDIIERKKRVVEIRKHHKGKQYTFSRKLRVVSLR